LCGIRIDTEFENSIRKGGKQTRMNETNAASRNRMVTATNLVSYFRETFKHYLPASTRESRKEQTFAVAFLGSWPVKGIYMLRVGSIFGRSSQIPFPSGTALVQNASMYSLVQHRETEKLGDIGTAGSTSL
jgi:hypothetical protein